MSLLVVDESGARHRATVATVPGFVINRPERNLFIGRKNHVNNVEGHFHGLIDEVRISPGADCRCPTALSAGAGKEPPSESAKK